MEMVRSSITKTKTEGNSAYFEVDLSGVREYTATEKRKVIYTWRGKHVRKKYGVYVRT